LLNSHVDSRVNVAEIGTRPAFTGYAYMFRSLFKIALSGICFSISAYICLADDSTDISEVFTSCYNLPFNQKTEMTDVVLVNSYYTNQITIQKISQNVIANFKNNAKLNHWYFLLDDLFRSELITNNSNIQIFRERVFGKHYRFDKAPPIKSFVQYQWNAGHFTNEHPFFLSRISVPPSEATNYWSLYDVQPYSGHVSVQTGDHPLISSSGLFINLFGLPQLFKFLVIIQTADIQAVNSQKVDDWNAPDAFQYFKVDKKRMDMFIKGNEKDGVWHEALLKNNPNIKQIYLSVSNELNSDIARIVFDSSSTKKKYLVYGLDQKTMTVSCLFAWDYDENGDPIRFLRIEHSPKDDKFSAWAQYIIHTEKTTNIDLSIFHVDLNKFKSIYDQRGAYPIQTVNGKVVFDASKDKYAPLPGQVVKSSGFDKTTIIRSVIFFVFIMPPLVMLIMAIKKRISK
jgi:hypothetical protein